MGFLDKEQENCRHPDMQITSGTERNILNGIKRGWINEHCPACGYDKTVYTKWEKL